MKIFSDSDGRIVRIHQGDRVQAGTITFPSLDFYEQLHVLIDGHGVAFKPVYQINDTLGGDILLMTFGESISPMNLRGIIFDNLCVDGNDRAANRLGQTKGVAAFIKWWTDNNLTSQRATPIEFTLSDQPDSIQPMTAYIADMTLTVDDAAERVWRFAMTLLRIPERRESDDARFANVPPPQIGISATPSNQPIGETLRRTPEEPELFLQQGRQSFDSLTQSLTPQTVSGFNPSSTPLVGAISGL